MSKWRARVTSAVVYNSICCVFVFHRITLSCLPASWYCSVSLLSLGCAPRQRLLLLLLLLITSVFFLLETYQRQLWGTQRRSGTQINKWVDGNETNKLISFEPYTEAERVASCKSGSLLVTCFSLICYFGLTLIDFCLPVLVCLVRKCNFKNLVPKPFPVSVVEAKLNEAWL